MVEQMLGSSAFFLMDVVTDFAIDFFAAQIEAAGPNCCPGIWPSFWFPRRAGIQMSDDNLVNVSPEVYAEFVVPYNNRVSEAFGGIFLHSCTIKEACLPVLHDLTGLTGINCDISTSVSTATPSSWRRCSPAGDQASGSSSIRAPSCTSRTQQEIYRSTRRRPAPHWNVSPDGREITDGRTGKPGVEPGWQCVRAS